MNNMMERIEIGTASIEYEVRGDGVPVLLIPVGIVADGLARPLFARPELASRYKLIHYHRRGYMGSTPGGEPSTIARQAADAAALLRHLGAGAAHVVGHSISALIALQLALDAPELVHSLSLLEPPLRMVSVAKEVYERIFVPMLNAYRAGDSAQALDIISSALFGPDWRSIIERTVPGGVEQAVKDMGAFVKEQATIDEWRFDAEEAAAIRQPVLSVIGLRSTPLAKKSRELLHAWLPQLEELDLDTTHLLQMQDPGGMARGLAEFFARHPMS